MSINNTLEMGLVADGLLRSYASANEKENTVREN